MEQMLVRVLHVYRDNRDPGKHASPARRAADGRVLILSPRERAGSQAYVRLGVPRGRSVFRRGALLRLVGEFREVGRSEVFEVRSLAPELSAAALKAMLEHGAAVNREGLSRILEMLDTAKIADALECVAATMEEGVRDLLLTWHSTEVAAVLELLQKVDPHYDVGYAFLVMDTLEHRAGRRGLTVPELLRNNPYVLAEVEGFRFSDAEALARALGVSVPCHRAVIAAVLNHLLAEARKGHSFSPRRYILGRLEKELAGNRGSLLKTYCGKEPDRDGRLGEWLVRLLIDHKERVKNDVREKLYGQGTAAPCSQYMAEARDDYLPLYVQLGLKKTTAEYAGISLYLSRVLVSEKRAAELLAALAGPGDLGRRARLDVAAVAASAGGLDQYQAEAVAAALENRVCVWVGYAGSGKTHAMRALAAALRDAGLKVVVMAPSALAASRAGSGLGVPFGTMHRWARVSPAVADYSDTEEAVSEDEKESGGGFWPRGAIEADVVFVDEMSMCDLLTFYHLLHAIYTGSNGKPVHLVLVGDPMQLPAIGPSGFFHQMCRLKPASIPVVELLGNHRSGDAICDFAHAVRNGRFDASSFAAGDGAFTGNAPLVLCEAATAKERERAVMELARAWKAAGLGVGDVMFLAARRFGGTENLNVVLRNVWNPGAREVPGVGFAVGDPVVSTRNDYADSRSRSRLRKMRHPGRVVDVYNGTRGVIADCREPSDGPVEVLVEWDTPEGKVTVPYYSEELPYYMEPAYALTVHKAQGGQAKYVAVVSMEGAMEYGMSRQMFYTAVTRAQEKLVLVGSKSYWEEAVGNVLPPPFTKFVYRLGDVVPVGVSTVEEEEMVVR